MYPLRLCALCTCGPKVVREAASLLSLGAERKVKVVGEGLRSLANDLLPFVRCARLTL
jgi:hypothetical protein